jgi:nitrite reductase (cytochrome c-552)
MKQSESLKGNINIWLVLLLIAAAISALFVGFMTHSVAERKAEGKFAYKPLKQLVDQDPRNEKWGENYPRQFERYYETADSTFRSKHNGNQMIDMLEVDPRLVILWAGYGFSKDYSQGRGHFYAIEDIHNTLRTGGPENENDGAMPATCWTCKSPDVPRLMKESGVEEFYKGKWAGKGHEVINTIGCADCHNSETMALQISRPALIEAFQRQGKDITKATHQEMRSLVCAQCHVEYYFKGEGNYLTFPWDKGTTAEDMQDYYDEAGFKDWVHGLSKAPMLKAQHPDYETYLTGVHAARGVSCADCHMPYRTEGGQKFTDHKIQSPLNNVANSCQVCHREESAELIRSVYERQDRILENRDKLEELLVRAHFEAKTAWDNSANDEQMKDILQDIRHAQWKWDFAAAAHGASFHSPVEISRVIAKGIVDAQEARIKLAKLLPKLGVEDDVPYPDISTKAKAQALIGLDMESLKSEKKKFKEGLLQEWLKKGAEREANY